MGSFGLAANASLRSSIAFLVVTQSQVKIAAVETAIGLSGIALYADRIIRDGIVIVSKLGIRQAPIAIGGRKAGLQPDGFGEIGDGTSKRPILASTVPRSYHA